jgi:hypothetical protein
MSVVQDISRPDVNGVPPKMKAICEQANEAINGLAPVIGATTDDNLCSNVRIVGSYQPKAEWTYGIFHNSPYFIFAVHPEKGKRYYTEGEKVTVELTSVGSKVPSKFRKYTGTPDKAIAKVVEWVKNSKPA